MRLIDSDRSKSRGEDVTIKFSTSCTTLVVLLSYLVFPTQSSCRGEFQNKSTRFSAQGYKWSFLLGHFLGVEHFGKVVCVRSTRYRNTQIRTASAKIQAAVSLATKPSRLVSVLYSSRFHGSLLCQFGIPRQSTTIISSPTPCLHDWVSS